MHSVARRDRAMDVICTKNPPRTPLPGRVGFALKNTQGQPASAFCCSVISLLPGVPASGRTMFWQSLPFIGPLAPPLLTLPVLFESVPETPIPLAGKVDFGVYDPTFYTAIDFTEDANMAVEGLPDTCTRQVIRPDPDTALAQNQKTLTEAFFNDPAGTDMSKIFATKLELDCQPKG